MVMPAAMLNRQQKAQIEKAAGKPVDQMSQEELQGHVGDLGLEPEGAPESAQGGSNYTAELEKLSELRSKGIITEEEFQAKKKQILGL
jgi:hypothetical protein